MKVASEKYIKVLAMAHYGEMAIPTGKKDGDRCEFIPINCPHKQTRLWLLREEIAYAG